MPSERISRPTETETQRFVLPSGPLDLLRVSSDFYETVEEIPVRTASINQYAKGSFMYLLYRTDSKDNSNCWIFR
jgi:hypothetical protein